MKYVPEAFPATYHLVGSIFNSVSTNFDSLGCALDNDSQVLLWDDRQITKEHTYYHIDSISIYYDTYITGYELQATGQDGRKITLTRGALIKGKQKTLTLDPDDFIVCIEVTKEEDRLFSIKLETENTKELYVEGSSGQGCDTHSIDLRGQNQAIIGFKGKVEDSAITSLTAYAWKLSVSNMT